MRSYYLQGFIQLVPLILNSLDQKAIFELIPLFLRACIPFSLTFSRYVPVMLITKLKETGIKYIRNCDFMLPTLYFIPRNFRTQISRFV